MKTRFLRSSVGFIVCFVMLLCLVTATATVTSADSDVLSIGDPVEYYGREALSKLPNSTALLYAYDRIAEGVEASSASITVYDGVNSITTEEVKLVFSTYVRDYAHHFWLGNGYQISRTSTTAVSVIPTYIMSGSQLEAAKAEFESAVAEMLSGITPSMSDYEKELYLHDRLAAKVTYVSDTNAHNSYGALVDGRAVCEGYAEALQYLLHRVGIRSFIATGASYNPSTGTAEGHAWNYVQIDGEYYHTDLTWNDQEGELYHAYFNVSDALILEDHYIDPVEIALPVCDSMEANYFTGKAEYLSSYTVEAVADLLVKNGMAAHVYIPGDVNGFVSWYYGNIVDIASSAGVIGGFSYGYSGLGRELVIKLITAGGHTHSYKSVVTPPTCISQGYTTYTCSCGDSYVGDYVPASGHKFVEFITKPTCTERGSIVYKCNCGYSYISEEIPATGHSFGEWYVVKEPTCDDYGISHSDCANCDVYQHREIEPTGHDFETVVTPPTCTAQGYTTYTCHCGYSYKSDYVAETGHTFGDWTITIAPTCTETGMKRQDCVYCDYFETREAEAAGHDYTVEVIKPTCTEYGYTSYTCKVCGFAYEEGAIPAKGHDYSDWVTIKEPTEEEEGLMEKVCYTCGNKETMTLPKLSHTHNYIAEVTEPTCTEQGYSTYTCRCGDSYVADYVSSTGHSFGDWIVIEEPTEEADGKKMRVCSSCEETEYFTIPSIDHIHEYTSTVTEPTCTTGGYTTYTCRCGYSYNAELRPSKGHDYSFVNIAPTCTEKGYSIYTCHCGDTYIGSYIDPVGHQEHTLPAIDPTCTENGYTELIICTKCNLIFVEREIIPATGHTPGNPYIENRIDPTCTDSGSYDTVVSCTNFLCDAELSRETTIVPAMGHDYASYVTEPTCTEQGYTTYSCCRCVHTYVGSYTPVRDHIMTPWFYSVSPTCTEAGEERRECADCDYFETRGASALGHTLESYPGKEPQCGVFGWKAYEICTTCGYSSYTEIPATGHTEGEAVKESEVKATCYAEGHYDMAVYCAVCGMQLSRETIMTPKADHPLGEEWIPKVEVTCLTDGEYRRYCLTCDYYESVIKKALGHDIIIHEAKAPTCTEDGWDTFETCSRCDLYTREIIQALGHTHGETVIENEVPASCTKAGGWDDVVYCSECNSEIVRTWIETPAVGHDFDSVFTVDSDPTYEAAGVKSRHCTRCDEVTDVTEIPQLVNTSVVYEDVKSKSWFRQAVDYAVSNGLMNGMTANTFEPNTTMSRAMLVTVLWRLEGSPDMDNNVPFTDLKQAWYKDAVAWAYENGIVMGTSTDKFSPNGNITREQMAAILYRYSSYKGADVSARADLSSYPDSGRVHDYALEAFAWANAEGLITGTAENGTTILAPRASATRAQVATILQRFCEK